MMNRTVMKIMIQKIKIKIKTKITTTIMTLHLDSNTNRNYNKNYNRCNKTKIQSIKQNMPYNKLKIIFKIQAVRVLIKNIKIGMQHY